MKFTERYVVKHWTTLPVGTPMNRLNIHNTIYRNRNFAWTDY